MYYTESNLGVLGFFFITNLIWIYSKNPKKLDKRKLQVDNYHFLILEALRWAKYVCIAFKAGVLASRLNKTVECQ